MGGTEAAGSSDLRKLLAEGNARWLQETGCDSFLWKLRSEEASRGRKHDGGRGRQGEGEEDRVREASHDARARVCRGGGCLQRRRTPEAMVEEEDRSLAAGRGRGRQSEGSLARCEGHPLSRWWLPAEETDGGRGRGRGKWGERGKPKLRASGRETGSDGGWPQRRRTADAQWKRKTGRGRGKWGERGKPKLRASGRETGSDGSCLQRRRTPEAMVEEEDTSLAAGRGSRRQREREDKCERGKRICRTGRC